jgi:hypothetical protein
VTRSPLHKERKKIKLSWFNWILVKIWPLFQSSGEYLASSSKKILHLLYIMSQVNFLRCLFGVQPRKRIMLHLVSERWPALVIIGVVLAHTFPNSRKEHLISNMHLQDHCHHNCTIDWLGACIPYCLMQRGRPYLFQKIKKIKMYSRYGISSC